MGLGVMTMNDYFTLAKVLELKAHYWMAFSIMSRINYEELNMMQSAISFGKIVERFPMKLWFEFSIILLLDWQPTIYKWNNDSLTSALETIASITSFAVAFVGAFSVETLSINITFGFTGQTFVGICGRIR